MQAHFAARDSRFHSDIFFVFDLEGATHALQPDGMFILDDRIILCEIKVRAIAIAWYQLRWIYGPLARKHFGKPICDLLVAKDVKLPIDNCPEPGWYIDDPMLARPAGLWVHTPLLLKESPHGRDQEARRSDGSCS